MDASCKQNPFDSYTNQCIHHKARSLARQPGFKKGDVEDIEQELRLEVLLRQKDYNPSRATYHTFVDRVITGKVAKLVRHRAAQQRDFAREECSLQDLVDDGDGDLVARADTLSAADDKRHVTSVLSDENRIALRCDLGTIMASLPPFLRELCERRQTESVAKVARSMAIPRTTLHDHIRRLRQRFAEAGLDQYLGRDPVTS